MSTHDYRDDETTTLPETPRITDLCAQLLAELAADGASVSVRGGPGVAELLHTTDVISTTLEELQFVLGEGPALAAYHTTATVQTPDLNASSAINHWPGFAPEAARTGAVALLTVPLQVESSTFGHVQIHRMTTGPILLTDRAHHLVSTMAREILATYDSEQGRPRIPLPSNRPDLHVAAGIVSVQLRLPVRHAMARICAAAFSEQRLVQDLANDIVMGRRVFDPADPD